MVRIAIRTITFNCLRGLALREPSRVVKDDHCFQFMSQPEPQRYFRQLVYYIISLIITMNNLCKDKWLCSEWMTASNYKDAYSLAQTVCDEFYILHDDELRRAVRDDVSPEHAHSQSVGECLLPRDSESAPPHLSHLNTGAFSHER